MPATIPLLQSRGHKSQGSDRRQYGGLIDRRPRRPALAVRRATPRMAMPAGAPSSVRRNGPGAGDSKAALSRHRGPICGDIRIQAPSRRNVAAVTSSAFEEAGTVAPGPLLMTRGGAVHRCRGGVLRYPVGKFEGRFGSKIKSGRACLCWWSLTQFCHQAPIILKVPMSRPPRVARRQTWPPSLPSGRLFYRCRSRKITLPTQDQSSPYPPQRRVMRAYQTYAHPPVAAANAFVVTRPPRGVRTSALAICGLILTSRRVGDCFYR
jgi:hypothetical protein